MSSTPSQTPTSSSFLVTLMRELDETPPPGKAWLGSTEWASATVTTCCFSGLAQNMSLITNAVFCLSIHNKTAWMHPRSKHWHLIDYVIVRKRDRQDVRVTKAMCGAECWTDQCLIVLKLNLRIKPKILPQGTKASKRRKLRLPFTSQHFADTLEKLHRAGGPRHGSSMEHAS